MPYYKVIFLSVFLVFIGISPVMADSWDDSPGVLLNKKTGSDNAFSKSVDKRSIPKSAKESRIIQHDIDPDEFIDIREAIQKNGTFGPVKVREKNSRLLRKHTSEDISKEQEFEKTLDGSDLRTSAKVESLPEKEKADSIGKSKEKLKPVASVISESEKPISQMEIPPVKSMLEDSVSVPEHEFKKTGKLENEPAPPIENVEQKEFVREDDPFLKKKDVANIPFKFNDGEKIDIFIDPRNIDDLSLWRDLRDNKSANNAILDGKVNVWLPPMSEGDVMPSMVFAYALEQDREKAMEFLDYIAFQAEGWLDIKHAAYMSEKERLARARQIDESVDEWMRRNGIDPDELYLDRGVMMKTAKSMDAMKRKFVSMARNRDRHPAVYVNGRERSGYFEKIRSLPMHQR